MGKLTKDQVAEIIELYEAGHSERKLAGEYGVTRDAIRYHCVLAGIKKRPADLGPQGFTERDASILELREKGIRVTHIGRALGIPVSSIRYRLNTLAIAQEAGAI